MNEEKKDKFSYTSSEVQKKRALTLFISEFILGGVVVALILGVLNYFNTFPISKMAPAQFGWLPTNSKPDITVSSQVKGYSIMLQNEGELIGFLNTWKVFETHNWATYGSTNGKKLQEINIVLVPDKIDENPTVGENEEIVVGSSPRLFDSKLEIRIYLASSILSSEDDPLVKGGAVLIGVITPIYRALYPSTMEKPNASAPKLSEVISDLSSKGFFSIVKQ